MELGDPSVKPIKVLGAGSFGRVFLCQYRSSQLACVKRIIVQNPKQDMKMVMEEIYIISQLRHPNIIRFIDSFVHAGTVNIIMEYAPNGTLLDLIKRSAEFSNANIQCFFSDILMGLEYLHIRNVFHRDLKPANLLVDKKYNIKIADFGISLIHTPCKSKGNMAGTVLYSAPEVLNGEKYDYKSDIWSFGCVLYEMCMGNSPFSHARNYQDLLYVLKLLSRQKLNCNPIRRKYGNLWANLCEKMIMPNLQQRISLPEIVCIDPALTLSYYNKYFDYKY